MNAPAYRIDGRVADRRAFYAVACDPRQSVVVEACAGSGKTWMLVSRMLRALLDGAEPHRLLAITFTRAAAGEMRERLAQWIAQWSAPRATHDQRVAALIERGLDAAEAERLAPALAGLEARLLQAGRPVEIRTFHAWFSQLMRSAPIEVLDGLGLQSDMTLVEDIDEHRPAILREFYAAVLRDDRLQEDFRAVSAARGRSQLGKWLVAAWHKRTEIELADAAGVLESSVEPAAVLWPAFGGLADPTQTLASPPWQERLGALASELGQGHKTAQNAAGGLVSASMAPDPRKQFEAVWSALFTDKNEPRKQLGESALLNETLQALIDLRSAVTQHDAHVEHGRMVRLVRCLLSTFALYKRSRGLADMADLERCALALLRDSDLAGWVQERLDSRIKHLLIDEFQDTSPLQWHAIQSWLAGYAGSGGGASGQQAPAVFIVGDPKQSLYRFRGAEPRIFSAAAHFVVEALAGRTLACDHTWRSAPAVVATVNSVFGAAQAAGEFTGFRVHTTEVQAGADDATLALPRIERPPAKQRAVAPERVWRDSLAMARMAPTEELRSEREAASVAAGIFDVTRAGRLALGDIFVLSRRRRSLHWAARALQLADVAYGAVEDAMLMESPEAQDLVALLDVLASPQHSLSLARALKSPLLGASDQDLVAMAERAAGETPALSWWAALFALPAPSAALARARRLLTRWADAAARLPPHDLLDRIAHEGDLRSRTMAAVPADRRQSAGDAIDAMFAQALLLDAGRYATPYGFVRALKRRAIKASSPPRQAAVRLMTIHGAKGLEADTVFVTDCDPEPVRAETTTLLVDWPIDAERPRRCAFLYAESDCPPSLQALLQAERQARERESLNALYVAMTRARRRLVFSAVAPRSAVDPPSWWQRLQPFVQAWQPEAGAAVPGQLPPGPSPAETLVMPGWRAHRGADATADLLAEDDGRSRAGVMAAGPIASTALAAAIGQAVHRALEWASASPPAPESLSELASAAAAEFAAPVAAVEHTVRSILQSAACARFFVGPDLLWSGNEVPIAEGGEVLRIDRLVRIGVPDSGAGAGAAARAVPAAATAASELRSHSEWWVLDYKLAHAPDALPAYRDQLLRYRRAVCAAQPGDVVRAAFITGDGRLVEVESS